MEKKLGDGLFRLLAPSVAGLLACVVCLCATSWAWFSASVTAAATTIRSASYSVNITITPAVEPTSVANGVTTYTLTEGQKYVIILEPECTAQNGYCVLNFGGVDYCTDKLTDTTLIFEVTGTGGDLIITPTWGICPETAQGLPSEIFKIIDPLQDVQEADPPESDAEPVEPPTTDEPADETKQPDETDQPGGDENPSGDSEPTTLGDNTPAEGEPTPATPDATTPDAPNATTPDTTSAPADSSASDVPSAPDASEPTA